MGTDPSQPLPAADERYDFDAIPFGQLLLRMASPGHKLEIHFDGHMPDSEPQVGKQHCDRCAAGNLPLLAVEQDGQVRWSGGHVGRDHKGQARRLKDV